MNKLVIMLFVKFFLLALLDQRVSGNNVSLKNWVDSCNSDRCRLALDECSATCNGISNCQLCLSSKDFMCTQCSLDVFNFLFTYPLNGVNYLQCNQNDPIQNSVCNYYCRGQYKNNGECKTAQIVTVCMCYSPFDGNLVKTSNTESNALYSVAASNFGDFATGSGNGGGLKIWDSTGNLKRTIFFPTGSYIESICFISSSEIAAVGNFGASIYGLTDGILKKNVKFDSWNCVSLAMLKNGDIAFCCSVYIYIWNRVDNTYKKVWQAHAGALFTLLSLPSGELVSGATDYVIRIWNPVDGVLKRSLTGHTSYIRSFALLQNGDLASVSNDATIRIWSVTYGTELRRIQTDHTEAITSLALLPNGNLATGSYDKSIKIWDKETLSLVKTCSSGHSNSVTQLAVLSNNFLVSVSTDKTFKLWN